MIRIPKRIDTLAAFRRWLRSDDFPERGRVFYLAGELCVDLSKEQLFTHNQVKQEFNLVNGGLVKAERLGRYFPDGAFVTNDAADLASQPDGTFVARGSFQACRVRLVEGEKEGFLEIDGSPDMALEVVSAGSVEKDTQTLRSRAISFMIAIDTNILVYAIDRRDLKKRAAARKLLTQLAMPRRTFCQPLMSPLANKQGASHAARGYTAFGPRQGQERASKTESANHCGIWLRSHNLARVRPPYRP